MCSQNPLALLDLGERSSPPMKGRLEHISGWMEGVLGVGVSLLAADLLLFLEVGRNVSKEGYRIGSSRAK